MIFRVLVLALFFFSCGKSSETIEEVTMDTEVNENMLLGSWMWTQSEGGIAGNVLTPATTGDSKCLEIDDSTISFITNDLVENEYNYDLVLDRTIFSVDSTTIMKIDGVISYSYELTVDKLILAEEVFDGFVHTYERK